MYTHEYISYIVVDWLQCIKNKDDYRRISSGHVTQFGDSLVIAFLSA